MPVGTRGRVSEAAVVVESFLRVAKNLIPARQKSRSLPLTIVRP
jgi:hypothetical protein